MRIALASPPIPKSMNHGLEWLNLLVQEAASKKAEIICFPESYLPGYPGMGYPMIDRLPKSLQAALDQVCQTARLHNIAIIIPMDWFLGDKLVNLVHVVSAQGEVLGYQVKVQLDPSEDGDWEPGTYRRLFELNGVKFGISICHEGFRYPETVRWAAMNGASIVFHPHFAGGNDAGVKLTHWGARENPYYEKAMQLRALENTIYFVSVNYASRFAESASSVIGPDGTCLAFEEYGRAGVLIADIDISKATGLLAKRFCGVLDQPGTN